MTARAPKIGLALGSGGARGWCHIGALRELDAMGVRPDFIAGASMGALVGAAYAAGRLDALEEWARKLTRARMLTYLDLRLTGGGLVAGSQVYVLLDQLNLPAKIEDLPIPFMAVACNMSTGAQVPLTNGPLAEAVRASVSIPGIFTPLHLNGDWLFDGGVVNPVPVSCCREMGADLVISIDPNSRDGVPFWTPHTAGESWVDVLRNNSGVRDIGQSVLDFFGAGEPAPRSPGYADVLSTSIDILVHQITIARMASDPPDLGLVADLGQLPVLELFRADEAIEAGAAAVRSAQPQIESLLRRRGT